MCSIDWLEGIQKFPKLWLQTVSFTDLEKLLKEVFVGQDNHQNILKFQDFLGPPFFEIRNLLRHWRAQYVFYRLARRDWEISKALLQTVSFTDLEKLLKEVFVGQDNHQNILKFQDFLGPPFFEIRNLLRHWRAQYVFYRLARRDLEISKALLQTVSFTDLEKLLKEVFVGQDNHQNILKFQDFLGPPFFEIRSLIRHWIAQYVFYRLARRDLEISKALVQTVSFTDLEKLLKEVFVGQDNHQNILKFQDFLGPPFFEIQSLLRHWIAQYVFYRLARRDLEISKALLQTVSFTDLEKLLKEVFVGQDNHQNILKLQDFLGPPFFEIRNLLRHWIAQYVFYRLARRDLEISKSLVQTVSFTDLEKLLKEVFVGQDNHQNILKFQDYFGAAFY